MVADSFTEINDCDAKVYKGCGTISNMREYLNAVQIPPSNLLGSARVRLGGDARCSRSRNTRDDLNGEPRG